MCSNTELLCSASRSITNHPYQPDFIQTRYMYGVSDTLHMQAVPRYTLAPVCGPSSRAGGRYLGTEVYLCVVRCSHRLAATRSGSWGLRCSVVNHILLVLVVGPYLDPASGSPPQGGFDQLTPPAPRVISLCPLLPSFHLQSTLAHYSPPQSVHLHLYIPTSEHTHQSTLFGSLVWLLALGSWLSWLSDSPSVSVAQFTHARSPASKLAGWLLATGKSDWPILPFSST